MDGRIVFQNCQGCGACLLTCPTHAIRPVAGALYVLDQLCTLCLECVEVCPVDAISIGHSKRRRRSAIGGVAG